MNLIQLQQDDPWVEAWSSIVGAYKAMHVLLNQEFLKNGFTYPQYRVLRTLGRFGPMPMNKLGEHMLVTPANITGIVDRLEERGYVQRRATGSDRRIITMSLTRRGKISYEETTDTHRRIVARIIKILNRDETQELIQFLQRIKEMALRERYHSK